MGFPYEAIGSGAVVGLVWLGKELVRKRKNNGNGKPGEAGECRERRREIDENSLVIKHLCENIEKKEKKDEKFQDQNNDQHEKLFDKLDDLKDKLIGG